MDFLARGDAGLLTGDDAHVVHGSIKQLVVAGGSANAHVHDDLLKTRNIVDVRNAELFLELRDDFAFVLFLQTRSSHFCLSSDDLNAGFPTRRPWIAQGHTTTCAPKGAQVEDYTLLDTYLSMSFPHFLQTRTFLPCSLTRLEVRVASLQFGQTSITLET